MTAIAAKLNASNMDVKTKKNVILIHGFRDHGLGPDWLKAQELLNKLGDVNVFSLEYSKLLGSRLWMFADVTGSITTASKVIGVPLIKTLQQLGAPGDRMHLVGYSIGAHMAMQLGYDLQPFAGRVTLLDPSKPLGSAYLVNLFEERTITQVIGYFIDVIHTSTDLSGIEEPIGIADFYPNSGREQPGCPPSRTDFQACSHHRALEYFIESIGNKMAFEARDCGYEREDSFLAHNCTEVTNHMGYFATVTGGNFYLNTNDKPPYSKNWGTMRAKKRMVEEEIHHEGNGTRLWKKYKEVLKEEKIYAAKHRNYKSDGGLETKYNGRRRR